jgi:hypothetical protein
MGELFKYRVMGYFSLFCIVVDLDDYLENIIDPIATIIILMVRCS